MGNEYAVQAALALFTWLFLLLTFNKAGKILLIACTLFAVLFYSNTDSWPSAARESVAAAGLRATYLSLHQYEAAHPGKGYPETIQGLIDPSFPYKYYRVKYVGLRRGYDGPFTGFLLTATPVFYACGPYKSFVVSEDGSVRYSEGNREATLADPEL